MKLAKIIKQDDSGWVLSDGTYIDPPVTTVVQYMYDRDHRRYVVYFPGCTAECGMSYFLFNDYFKDLTDETGEDN